MTWEIQLLLAHPNMLGKTLAIVSADDPPSDKLAEVTTNARWKVQVESRNSYGGNFPKVPEELLGLISRPKD